MVIADPSGMERRSDAKRLAPLAGLLAALLACAACSAEDPRAELLALSAASDPGERHREITACTYDAVVARHGSEVARELVAMAQANRRGEALPSDARAVLALSLQEAGRCAERLRREQGVPAARPRETGTSRGSRS